MSIYCGFLDHHHLALVMDTEICDFEYRNTGGQDKFYIFPLRGWCLWGRAVVSVMEKIYLRCRGLDRIAFDELLKLFPSIVQEENEALDEVDMFGVNPKREAEFLIGGFSESEQQMLVCRVAYEHGYDKPITIRPKMAFAHSFYGIDEMKRHGELRALQTPQGLLKALGIQSKWDEEGTLQRGFLADTLHDENKILFMQVDSQAKFMTMPAGTLGECRQLAGDIGNDSLAAEIAKHGKKPKTKFARQPSESGQDHKVGRNESCPCGSGKKYKKCCGK